MSPIEELHQRIDRLPTRAHQELQFLVSALEKEYTTSAEHSAKQEDEATLSMLRARTAKAQQKPGGGIPSQEAREILAKRLGL